MLTEAQYINQLHSASQMDQQLPVAPEAHDAWVCPSNITKYARTNCLGDGTMIAEGAGSCKGVAGRAVGGVKWPFKADDSNKGLGINWKVKDHQQDGMPPT